MKSEDQVVAEKVDGQSQEKPASLDDQFEKGWEQVLLVTEQENAAKAKTKEGQPPAGEKKKESGDSTSKPYKVLKVGGKDVPVKSEEELIELAQKGADYTKKTQGLADDRREAEAQVKKETDRLADATEKMAALADRLVKAGILPSKIDAGQGREEGKAKTGSEISEDLAKIYEEFNLDPANAYPHEKKLVEEHYALKKRLDALEEKVQMANQEKAEALIQSTISKERESFPFDDIHDDQGNDITLDKLKAIVGTKKALAGVEKPDVNQVIGWLKEAVQELHATQKGNGGSSVSDDMDPNEFADKFPGLVKKLKDSAVEKDKAERDKLPPTLSPGKRDIDATKRPGVKAVRDGSKSLDDFLEEGFKDPDVLKALNGG